MNVKQMNKCIRISEEVNKKFVVNINLFRKQRSLIILGNFTQIDILHQKAKEVKNKTNNKNTT